MCRWGAYFKCMNFWFQSWVQNESWSENLASRTSNKKEQKIYSKSRFSLKWEFQVSKPGSIKLKNISSLPIWVPLTRLSNVCRWPSTTKPKTVIILIQNLLIDYFFIDFCFFRHITSIGHKERRSVVFISAIIWFYLLPNGICDDVRTKITRRQGRLDRVKAWWTDAINIEIVALGFDH